MLGYSKEIFRDEIPSWFGNDIGWDDNVIRANEAGQKFAGAWRKNFNDNYLSPTTSEKKNP